MKRSEINTIMRKRIDFLGHSKFKLIPILLLFLCSISAFTAFSQSTFKVDYKIKNGFHAD